MSLFDVLENQNKQIPLAETLRPKTLDEYLGQYNLIKENSAIWNLLKSGRLFSLILWGPPGCGKTTLSRIIANETNSNFIELSAVSSGVKDLKETIEKAKIELRSTGRKTLLFIDEIHRYTKTQQDALLPHLEKGTVYLTGSTTENPSFQIAPALLSRVQVVQLNHIDDENLLKIIRKGYKYLIDKYGKIELDSKIGEFIVNHSGGDARIALNIVESSYFCSPYQKDSRKLTIELIENLTQKQTIKYGIQEHYDHASAFQKSIRGSDANAAIYWLAKMLLGGEDPRFISRRLIVIASEDIGNADPAALTVALNAHKAVETLGLPECRITLAQTSIYLAKAKKSNEAIIAIDTAMNDIAHKGLNYSPPNHLKDSHYKDAQKYGFGVNYIYTHSNPNTNQQFLPDEMKDKKYCQD